jgi:hypothetical protein
MAPKAMISHVMQRCNSTKHITVTLSAQVLEVGFDASASAEGVEKDYYAEEIIKTRSQHKVAADNFQDLLFNHLDEHNRKIAERALLHVQAAQRAKKERAKEDSSVDREELMKAWNRIRYHLDFFSSG